MEIVGLSARLSSWLDPLGQKQVFIFIVNQFRDQTWFFMHQRHKVPRALSKPRVRPIFQGHAERQCYMIMIASKIYSPSMELYFTEVSQSKRGWRFH